MDRADGVRIRGALIIFCLLFSLFWSVLFHLPVGGGGGLSRRSCFVLLDAVAALACCRLVFISTSLGSLVRPLQLSLSLSLSDSDSYVCSLFVRGLLSIDWLVVVAYYNTFRVGFNSSKFKGNKFMLNNSKTKK